LKLKLNLSYDRFVHSARAQWSWIALAALITLSPTLNAATWYVATTGNDGSAGTQTAPFATIQKGVNSAKAGDTVLVSNGTYGPNGQYTCGDICSQNGYSAPVTFSNSGTSSAPITIAAQNKWGAVLDCQLPSGYSGNGTDGVKACDTYFNFQGSASYITISGFDIQREYWVGAMVNATNSHIIFSQNHFHNIGNRIYTVPSGTSSFGIVGVFAGSGSSYITWDRNEFNNIGRVPHSGSIISDDYTHDHGLYIYNGPYTITNNIFYSQPAGWNVQTSPGSHDINITNNTLIGGANPQHDGCMILWGQNTNVTIQNNIFYNGTNYAIDNYQTTQSGSLFDHNIVYGSPSGIVSSIGGSITETNNKLNTNPVFVNATSLDYHVQAGSPAIDSGASVSVATDFNGGPRPLGAAFDIGAYEYSGAVTMPGAPSTLAATAPSGTTGINLTWANGSPAGTATLVQRSSDNVTFSQIASLSGTATSYADSGLAASTTYYYRAAAQNSTGMSGYSNTASTVTGSSVSTPGAPSTLAATAASGSTGINLTWKNGSPAGTATLLQRSVDNVTFSQIASLSGTATSYADSGLAASTT